MVRAAEVKVLRCTICHRAGPVEARWGALAYSACQPRRLGASGPWPTWEREFHRVVASGPRSVRCTRCACAGPSSRLAQLAGRMCVARRLFYNGIPFATDWGAQVIRSLGWLRGPEAQVLRPTVVQQLQGAGPGHPAVSSVPAQARPRQRPRQPVPEPARKVARGPSVLQLLQRKGGLRPVPLCGGSPARLAEPLAEEVHSPPGYGPTRARRSTRAQASPYVRVAATAHQFLLCSTQLVC